ncbi:uncharacterized protein LOC131591688 [Poecile atricapillus]|uniref:uncharacterized protein LOC131591688 n=1 Tax=Poecile atricapillus TaxID=48891 RepID=UPI0027383DC8|nr:uncharacterized protein LOC131591688 [Poecile atricapillus]
MFPLGSGCSLVGGTGWEWESLSQECLKLSLRMKVPAQPGESSAPAPSLESRRASGMAGVAPALSPEPFPQLQRETEPPPALAAQAEGGSLLSLCSCGMERPGMDPRGGGDPCGIQTGSRESVWDQTGRGGNRCGIQTGSRESVWDPNWEQGIGVGSSWEQGSNWDQGITVGSSWEQGIGVGSNWERRDKAGSSWKRRDKAGSSWERRDKMGSSWKRRDKVGSSWIRWDPSGRTRIHPGASVCSWQRKMKLLQGSISRSAQLRVTVTSSPSPSFPRSLPHIPPSSLSLRPNIPGINTKFLFEGAPVAPGDGIAWGVFAGY